MTLTKFMLCCSLLLLICLPGWCAGVEVKTTPPTEAGTLALADRYLKEVTPKLSLQEKTAIDNVKFTLDAQKNVPTFREQSIDELVNHCTIALANTDAIMGVIVTSGTLVKLASRNARVTNLFGAVLQTIGKHQEAIAVFEYTRTLKPKSELVMLNAANTYLDLNKDEKAKELIDKVLEQDDQNKSAYSTLACYWYKKGDMKKTLEALMKAASFGGGVVQKKAEENNKITEANLVSGNDEIETIEQKLAKVNALTPKTTADLIEDQFPDAARQIRDKYCKLVDNEKMIMPPLPQVNTSGLKNWIEKGAPYIKEWGEAFGFHTKNAMMEIAHIKAGINPGDSKAVTKQKAMAAGSKEVQKTLIDAQKMLNMMENMPGISAAQLAQARKKMQAALAKQKGKLDKIGVHAPTEAEIEQPKAITCDADAEKIGADDVPPGFDYGSVFAATNYRDFMFIRNGYEIYFLKYFKKYQADVMDIFKVYGEKLTEQDTVHDENMQKIADEEKRAQDAAVHGGGAFSDAKYELERRKENLRYKKIVNALGDDYFAQWVNVALPQYQHKMKPMLDQYWAVCALYIRNMNQPEVLKNEYCRVKQMFWMYGGMAVGSMGGGTFKYMGETDEEERQLEADIKVAEEDAKGKREGYKQETKAADNAFVNWLEDNFALKVAGEFLTLKVTPRRLTVEEYIAGMNFKHVFDFKTGEWTTYRSFAAKVDIGIQVGPLKAGVSARADILESYDTLNIRTGQVVSSGSRFATGSVGGSIGDSNVSVGGSLKVTLDPAAQNELTAKFSSSLGVKGKVGDGVTTGVTAP